MYRFLNVIIKNHIQRSLNSTHLHIFDSQELAHFTVKMDVHVCPLVASKSVTGLYTSQIHTTHQLGKPAVHCYTIEPSRVLQHTKPILNS